MLGRLSLAAGTAFAALLAAGCAVELHPLRDDELSQLAQERVVQVVADQEANKTPITLYEAMARAIKYNQDYRLELMQAELRNSELHLASREMLPKAVANASYAGRNSDLALGHLDLPTNTYVEPTTTSQDRIQSIGDATFSWNILDFALSYVRARQAADKFLIAEEARRKVIQRIIEDTRTAYWRAVSAERLTKRLAALEARAQRAIGDARALQDSGDISPTGALTYERELVQIKNTSQQLVRDLALARAQLAALMNLDPATKFSLAGSDGDLRPVMLGLSGREMLAEALFNRPELRDVAYQKRINEAEAIAAWLELLPGAQLFLAENSSSNSYLLHGHWMTMGVTAAENLLKVFQLPARRNLIEAQDEVLDQKLLAMTMVVITQVYMSRTRYRHFAKELEIATGYNDVQSRLVAELRAQANADKIGEQTLLREEMNALLAELKRDIAYANVQNAAANVFVSMGLDLQSSELKRTLGVKELATHLKAAWADRAAVSPRGRYLMELEAARAEARRQQEEAQRKAKLEAEVRARQEAIARETELAKRSGGGGLKDYGSGGLKDGRSSGRADKPYSGVK